MKKNLKKVEQKEVELQNIYNHNLIIYYDREIGKEDLLKSVQNYRAELLYDYDNINGIAIKYHLISLFERRFGIFNKSKEYCQ